MNVWDDFGSADSHTQHDMHKGDRPCDWQSLMIFPLEFDCNVRNPTVSMLSTCESTFLSPVTLLRIQPLNFNCVSRYVYLGVITGIGMV